MATTQGVNVSAVTRLKVEFITTDNIEKYNRLVDFTIEVADVPVDNISSILDRAKEKLVDDIAISINPMTNLNTTPISNSWATRQDNNGTAGVTFTINKSANPNTVSAAISGANIRHDYINTYVTSSVNYLKSQLGLD